MSNSNIEVHFPRDTKLYRELQKEVNAYFKDNNIKRTGNFSGKR